MFGEVEQLGGTSHMHAGWADAAVGSAGLDWIALTDWSGLNWIGLNWIGLDWTGLDWTG